MKKFTKVLFLTMIFVFCFGMNVLAAETEEANETVETGGVQARDYFDEYDVGEYCNTEKLEEDVKTFYVIGVYGLIYDYSDGNWASINKTRSYFELDSVYYCGYPAEVYDYYKTYDGDSSTFIYSIILDVDNKYYEINLRLVMDIYGDVSINATVIRYYA